MSVILVSWILALLTVFSLTFHHEARTDLRLASLQSDAVVSRALARSGVALAQQILRQNARSDWEAPIQGWDRNGALRRVALGLGFASVGYRDRPEAEASYGVQDEERRIPLRMLTSEILERFDGMTPEAVERILRHQELSSAEQPIHPALLPGLDEPIRGMLRDYVTAYPTEGVNINSASGNVLRAIGIPARAVERILARRDGRDGVPGTADDQPFRSLLVPEGGLRELELDSDEAAVISILSRSGHLIVASRFFRIRARGWIEGNRTFCEVDAVFRKGESGVFELLDWKEQWRS